MKVTRTSRQKILKVARRCLQHFRKRNLLVYINHQSRYLTRPQIQKARKKIIMKFDLYKDSKINFVRIIRENEMIGFRMFYRKISYS